MNSQEPILTLTDLTVSFPGHPVFAGLNFTVHRGDFVSIIGENGVGKTTLMRTILAQLRPTRGAVQLFPSRKAVTIGYVPQFRNIDPEYPLSVRDFVALNLTGWRLPWLTHQEKQVVRDTLHATGLDRLTHQTMGRASGGEKQKAYLAQALVEQPDLLILDESTASLDPVTKTELLDLVASLNQEQGLTVLFVTHDIDMARRYTSRYLHLTTTGHEAGPIASLSDRQVWGPVNV